jgi:glucan phosphoethanolaminetransferase (alkaline phosphatase superfamily)
MSLFGYDKDTTPNLRELSKENNFYYTTGISSGTGTLSSCKFMMNVIYEPDNAYQTSSDLTNLFRLAKQKNFKTFYVSSQRDNVLTSIAGVNYIDTIITNGASIINVVKITDEMLPDIVSDNKLGKRNFIVLHQRCMHSPYSSYFSDTGKSSQKKQLINEYDEAMLYNDYLISKMFNKFNKQGAGKFYIIWASDHNELLGEDGLYGHGTLSRYTADIPIMIQSNDIEFMKIMKAIFKPTHYEIAKNIAKILGYEIINPNEEENVFYINGVDFTGRCGYIRFKKDVVNHRIEYFKGG